jgi:acyl-CoA synthetase (NDP forming)
VPSRSVADVAERLRSMAELGEHDLGEGEMRDALADGPIAFSDAITCDSPNQAVDAGRRLGYPVVVKALAPGLLHKSELGLVSVGLEDDDAVGREASLLLARARRLEPGSQVRISVQRQLSGIELSVGIIRDSLGPLCVVAAGGVNVELLKDSAAAMAPVRHAEALVMLQSLRLWPALVGYRGGPMFDVESVIQLIIAVSDLAMAVPDLAQLDLNPVFVGIDGCVAADAACVFSPAPTPLNGPSLNDGVDALTRIFTARRIVIVGGVHGDRQPGALLIRYLRMHGYAGEVIVVTQNTARIDGATVCSALSDVHGRIELVCIAVPREVVPQVVRECAAVGVQAGIIYSSGFAEAGIDGARLQKVVIEQAGTKFRFVGPNSYGVASVWDHMLATFGMSLELPIEPGAIGFVSQSGAIASSLLSRALEFGVAFSAWITVGNEADLGVADSIAYLAEDPRTRVICMFLEVIRHPEAFAEACDRARAAGKPVIAIKTGRSEAGRQAASLHTAAVAGSDTAYEAFLRRSGVIRVSSLSGLLCAARGLLTTGPVAGNRVGIISMSGGVCSLLADMCSQAGLEVPELTASTQEEILGVIPRYGSPRNPIDVTVTGVRHPEMIKHVLTIVRRSHEVDLVLVQLSTNADPAAEQMALDLSAIQNQTGPPVLIGRLGSALLAPRAMEVYRRAGIHVYSWPEELVDAASASVRFGMRSLALDRRSQDMK